MKKLFFTLLMSIGGTLFAQTINHDQQWNQAIEMQLKNNAKAYVVSNVTPLFLDAYKLNLDSVVKVALSKYKEIEEETTDELASKSVTYHYGLNDKNWKYSLRNPKEGFTVKIHPATEKRYGVMEGNEFVRLKTMKDTLVINLIFGELPDEYKEKTTIRNVPRIGYQISYGFIVNNLSDLETIDYEQVRIEIKKSTINIKQKIGLQAMLRKPTMPIGTITQVGTANTRLNYNSQVSQIITFTGGFGGGWIRDKFVTDINSNILIVTKGRVGFGFGAMQLFHFNNLPDKSFKVTNSTFVNLQISSFNKDPRKKLYGTERFMETGVFSVGLLAGKSDFFSKNTFRISVMLPIVKHLSVEAETYYEHATNQVYPSIRFKIM